MKANPQQAHPRRPIDLTKYLIWAALVVILGVSAWLIARKPAPVERTVAVPNADLPAYHLLRAVDLTDKALAASSIPKNVVAAQSDLIGKYTLVPLPAGKEILDTQVHSVPDPALISNTVAVGIPATPAQVMGGTLEAGETIDILLVSPASETSRGPTPSVFEEILVLDVRAVPESQSAKNGAVSQPFVLVIALPVDQRLDFANASSGAALLVARKP